MEPDAQDSRPQDLDHQVEQALAELQASGEPITAESVRRRVGRRMTDVLAAMRRVTGMGPAVEPDLDLPAEAYPAVLEAARKVEAIAAAIQDAEQTLQDREALLTRAEAAAAEALIDGRAPLSLDAARQSANTQAELVALLQQAQSLAKARHAEALTQAQAQHWAAQWQGYQREVAAFDHALSQAYAAQQVALATWNRIGQPQEPPLLKGPLSVFADDFHPFLQHMILDQPPEAVQRGTSYAGVRPQPHA